MPRLASLGAAAMVVLLAACGGPDAAADTAPTDTPAVVSLMPADVDVARLDSLAGGITLSGTLEPARRVVLKAQLDGTIASLRVDRGSPVRRGELLASIDAAGVTQQGASMDAAIAAAKAGLTLAEQRRDGARVLFEKGAISRIDLRAAEAQYEAAAAELEGTAARAAGAREAADRTRLVAPMDGVIADRHVQEGEPVSNGNAMLTLVDPSTLELAGQVGVDVAGQLAVGQRVEFTLASRPDERFAGRIARIDPEADPSTRQVGVYVSLPNRTHRLIAGQFATGRILLETSRSLVVVPSAALRSRGDSTWVSTVVDGQVRAQPVRVLARDEARGLVGVSDGLDAGTRVLVMPGAGLEPGTAVRLVTGTTPNDSGRTPRPAGEAR